MGCALHAHDLNSIPCVTITFFFPLLRITHSSPRPCVSLNGAKSPKALTTRVPLPPPPARGSTHWNSTSSFPSSLSVSVLGPAHPGLPLAWFRSGRCLCPRLAPTGVLGPGIRSPRRRKLGPTAPEPRRGGPQSWSAGVSTRRPRPGPVLVAVHPGGPAARSPPNPPLIPGAALLRRVTEVTWLPGDKLPA